MELDERNKRLKALIDVAKKDIYVEEYQEKATDAEVLGVMVAQYHEWAGQPIFKTIQNCLEDANFHTLNDKFSDLVGVES